MKGSYDNEVIQKKMRMQMEVEQDRSEEQKRIERAQNDLEYERQRKMKEKAEYGDAQRQLLNYREQMRQVNKPLKRYRMRNIKMA